MDFSFLFFLFILCEAFLGVEDVISADSFYRSPTKSPTVVGEWMCDDKYDFISGIRSQSRRYYPIYRKKESVITSCQSICTNGLLNCVEFWYKRFSNGQVCVFFNAPGKLTKHNRNSESCVCFRVPAAQLDGSVPLKCGGFSKIQCPRGFKCGIYHRRYLAQMFGRCIPDFPNQHTLLRDKDPTYVWNCDVRYNLANSKNVKRRYFPLHEEPEFVVEICKNLCDNVLHECLEFAFRKHYSHQACLFYSKRGRLLNDRHFDGGFCFRIRRNLLNGTVATCGRGVICPRGFKCNLSNRRQGVCIRDVPNTKTPKHDNTELRFLIPKHGVSFVDFLMLSLVISIFCIGFACTRCRKSDVDSNSYILLPDG